MNNADTRARRFVVPEQITVAQARHLYRAGRLGRGAHIYGVIGDPIHHSLSPLLHNTAFRHRRIDALYLPFLVEEVRDFLPVLEELNVRGFSVTIPHKESILRFLDHCDPLASAIGAANTVTVQSDGRLSGCNTDYAGVLEALRRRMKIGGSRVLILGAGGAARAVAFALRHEGAAVFVSARRPRQAETLARLAGGDAIEPQRLRHLSFDALVNTTPVGMYPHTDKSPLEAEDLNCRLVFDSVYRPLQTRLLQLAEARGIETVSGVEMFIAQGVAQWELWTGRTAPVRPMRAAILKQLNAELNGA
jgi:3-dehydroquinate dehydratase/shikimate dehydrogenase